MKCKNCGSEIENGLMYCPNCGESVQLVPDYNVLEEELLSRVVEDKRKAKDDKFASGVYKTSDEPTTKPELEKTPAKAPEFQVFTKKIRVFLFAAVVAVLVLGVCLIIPYMGTHTYDSLMNHAIKSETNKEYAKALGYFEEAYQMDNTSFEAAYGLGRMYYRVKDYENAIKMLNIALERDPGNKNIYEILLDCYDYLGDKDAIYALAEKATDDDIKDLIASYIVLPPSFSIEGGDYEEDQLLQLSAAGNNQIFYTINGKNPTTSGKLYSKPIVLTEGTTVIKAVAQSSSGEYSAVATAEYVITYKQLSMPVVSPVDGVYKEQVMISITVPDGCTAYYTWDGTSPATNGIKYTEPFQMPAGSAVLSVVIKDAKGNVSPTYYGNYIYQP